MEILVVAKDRPVPDSPARWLRGDVVVIRDDGHAWGREELDPEKFILIRVPGVLATQVGDLLEEKLDPGEPLLGIEPRLLGRRARFLADTLLERAQRDQRIRIADVLSARRDRG